MSLGDPVDVRALLCEKCCVPKVYCRFFGHLPDDPSKKEDGKEDAPQPKPKPGLKKKAHDVVVKVEKRGGKKRTTIVRYLATWDCVDIKEIAKYIKKKLVMGCSDSVDDSGDTVLTVQGDAGDEIVKMLVEKGIPRERIKYNSENTAPPPIPISYQIFIKEKEVMDKVVHTNVQNWDKVGIKLRDLSDRFEDLNLEWEEKKHKGRIVKLAVHGEVGNDIKNLLTKHFNISDKNIKLERLKPDQVMPSMNIMINVSKEEGTLVRGFTDKNMVLNIIKAITETGIIAENRGTDIIAQGEVQGDIVAILTEDFSIPRESITVKLYEIPFWEYLMNEVTTVSHTSDSPSKYVLHQDTRQLPSEEQLVITKEDEPRRIMVEIKRLFEEEPGKCDLIAKACCERLWLQLRDEIIDFVTRFNDPDNIYYYARFVAYITNIYDRNFGTDVVRSLYRIILQKIQDKLPQPVTHIARLLAEIGKFTYEGRMISTENEQLGIMKKALDMCTTASVDVFYVLAIFAPKQIASDPQFSAMLDTAEKKYEKRNSLDSIARELKRVIEHYRGVEEIEELKTPVYQAYTRHLMWSEEGDIEDIVAKVQSMVERSEVTLVDVNYVLDVMLGHISQHTPEVLRRLAVFTKIYSETDPLFATIVTDILMERINLNLEYAARYSYAWQRAELMFFTELVLAGVIDTDTAYNTMMLLLCAGQTNPVNMQPPENNTTWRYDFLLVELACNMLRNLGEKLTFKRIEHIFYWIQYFALVRGVASNPNAMDTLKAMRAVVLALPNGNRLRYKNIAVLHDNLATHHNKWIEEDSFPYALGTTLKRESQIRETEELLLYRPAAPMTNAKRDDREFEEEYREFMKSLEQTKPRNNKPTAPQEDRQPRRDRGRGKKNRR